MKRTIALATVLILILGSASAGYTGFNDGVLDFEACMGLYGYHDAPDPQINGNTVVYMWDGILIGMTLNGNKVVQASIGGDTATDLEVLMVAEIAGYAFSGTYFNLMKDYLIYNVTGSRSSIENGWVYFIQKSEDGMFYISMINVYGQ